MKASIIVALIARIYNKDKVPKEADRLSYNQNDLTIDYIM